MGVYIICVCTYFILSMPKHSQFNIVNRIHNGVTIQLNKNTSNQINNINNNVRSTTLLPPPSLPNIPLNLPTAPSPLSNSGSNLTTTQFLFDGNSITPTLLNVPMLNAQNMQNFVLNQSKRNVNQQREQHHHKQSKVMTTVNQQQSTCGNLIRNNVHNQLTIIKYSDPNANNQSNQSRNYRRHSDRNHRHGHRHRHNDNNNTERRNRKSGHHRRSYDSHRRKRFNQNNNNSNHRKHRTNHNGKQREDGYHKHNISQNDEETKMDESEQQGRSKNENREQDEENVWCPYYQYGCKTHFPKAQTQNHLRSAYREHLIIQVAEMYKLVNLIISTVTSFPTFDQLIQQPPIDMNNEAVSNAIQYLSQHNAHLVSLLTQKQQPSHAKEAVSSDTKQKKCKVITEEMEQFASNLRLPRPQLPASAAFQSNICQDIPIKSCPINAYPYIVTVSGRAGFNSEINGDYYLLPKLHQNRPCYKKLRTSWCIRWNEATMEWMIDCDGLKHDNVSCARVNQDCAHPALVTNAWRVYNNPRHLEDDKVTVCVSANVRSEAAAYCKSKCIAWPPFTESDIQKAMNQNDSNDRYGLLRQTSHSRHNSTATSVNNSNRAISEHQEEIKMNVEYDHDVNMDDEELRQQRQRHQDQYLESMPTSQNGYIHVYPHQHQHQHRNSQNNQNKSGIIISTVSVCHPQSNQMKEVSPCSFPSQSQSQYSITSDTQSVSVSQSILEKTIVESQEPSTSHLVPVHEDNIDFITKTPEMSANLSFSNVSNKAVKLEISLDHRNSLSAEQDVDEENESENKMNARHKPPLKNGDHHSVIHLGDSGVKCQGKAKRTNDCSPSKSARRKNRRKHKKSSTK